MARFKLSIDRKDKLTSKDIKDLGWIEKSDFSSDLKQTFEKGNYFLVAYTHIDTGPVIRIFAKDPSKIEWLPDPEQFSISIPCPTKEAFEFITNLLPK